MRHIIAFVPSVESLILLSLGSCCQHAIRFFITGYLVAQLRKPVASFASLGFTTRQSLVFNEVKYKVDLETRHMYILLLQLDDHDDYDKKC